MKYLLSLALIAPAAGAAAPALSPATAAPLAKSIALRARALGQDSRDQALAALYNRLFALQDLKRDAELESEIAELSIDDAATAYKRLDRWMDKQKLKEVAVDPNHRDYPNITEKTKLALVASVGAELRKQKIAALRIARYEADVAAVERMIEKHLAVREGTR